MTSPELGLKSNNSVCPRCGAGLRCAMVAGDEECWCAQLPLVMPIAEAGSPHPNPPPAGEGTVAPPPAGKGTNAPAASCFCPDCLQQIINEQTNTIQAAGN